jgi:glycosyltransferase involved in cell wall biosynthesis
VKILHLTTHWTGGGSERNIAHTVECLRGAGHDVHLGVGRMQEQDVPRLPIGVAIHRVPSLDAPVRVVGDTRAFRELSSLLRREKFDLVHTHLAKAGVIGRIAAHRWPAPVVHTVHNLSALRNPIYRFLERRAAIRTQLFVFVGTAARDVYATQMRIPVSVTRVIRSPVGITTFRAVRRRRSTNSDGSLRAVVVSRLVADKGLGVLAEVLAAVPELFLHVAGSGNYGSNIMIASKRMGVSHRIKMHGWLQPTELAALYSSADVLLHVSSQEALPQVGVQALAAGMPIVGVRSVGLCELVEDGYNGLIVPSSSPGQLAGALGRVAEDPIFLGRLTDGANEFDPSPWDEREICKQHVDLVNECVSDDTCFGVA